MRAGRAKVRRSVSLGATLAALAALFMTGALMGAAPALAGDVFPAEHGHAPGCGHFHYDGAWHLFPAEHEHAPGCGHYLVEGRWSYFPSAHRHSFECGHFYFDGMWHPFAPGHAHGEGCGHYLVRGAWSVFPEGHVHKQGCGHVFLDGEWRAATPPAVPTGASAAPVAPATERNASAALTPRRVVEPEPAEVLEVVEPRPLTPLGRAVLVEERYTPAGAARPTEVRLVGEELPAAPAAAREAIQVPSAPATPQPSCVAPVAPPRIYPAPLAYIEPSPVILTLSGGPVIVVGPRAQRFRGSQGVPSASNYGGRWDPGTDVRYEWRAGAGGGYSYTTAYGPGWGVSTGVPAYGVTTVVPGAYGPGTIYGGQAYGPGGQIYGPGAVYGGQVYGGRVYRGGSQGAWGGSSGSWGGSSTRGRR